MQPDLSVNEVETLLHIAASILYKDANPQGFLDWIAEAGPQLAPSFAAALNPDSRPADRLFRSLGVQIYNATPLREYHYRTKPMQMPGRNDACYCGSGHKFKHCCLSLMNAAPPLDNYNMLRHVLDVMPKTVLATLPDTAVDWFSLLGAAWHWQEQGETDRVIALLQPWFAANRKLKADQVPAFDLLMDAYLRSNEHQKRERLLKRLLESDVKELRATALQRKTTMLMDAGRSKDAWHHFQLAQREDPTDPALSHLEIVLLVNSGEVEQTKQRARYWLLRLQKQADASPELLQFLREAAENPQKLMERFSSSIAPGLAELSALEAQAPAVDCQYQIDPGQPDEGELQPRQQLLALEERWYDVYPLQKPFSIQTQINEDLMWDDPSRWLAFLSAEPLAWQSFTIIDDLVLAVELLRVPGIRDSLLIRLLARGQALLQAALATTTSVRLPVRLPWSSMENRPALRLLAHHVFNFRYQQGMSSAAIAAAELLLSLNPSDNHGIRYALTQLYLESDKVEQALALTERYDDTMTAMALNRVLILHRLNRSGEALSLLATLATQQRTAITMLLATDPKQPAMSADGTYQLGSKAEAWGYRLDFLSLWQSHGALDWLNQAWSSLRRRNRNTSAR
jgi:tetratricopeptide (TPR) repeat protein